MARGSFVEYRILGPLQVLLEGATIDVGPRKQQSLLALLLINANRVVATDHILEALWGDDAAGKENAQWVYISRLRAILEPDRDKGAEPETLITKGHGYQLVVDPQSIDAHRFEQTVIDADRLIKDDPVTASTSLREALAEWRGTALQDFAYDEFAQTEITRLSELRLKALEDAVEADLRTGKAGELIGELEVHHQHNPLRERPVSLLMLALYRAGRSADALRTFERFRRALGEELGIQPSPELARLEEQILLHDSRLQVRRPARYAPAGAVPQTNPYQGLRPFTEDDAGSFFGRDRLVAEMVRRLAEGDRLLAVVGPSGSGKSSAVRAGLIPWIRKGGVSGSDHWLIAHMLPGNEPFIELEAALLRSSIDAPDNLAEQLAEKDPSSLRRAALRLLPSESDHLLLVVDQFEELFTLVDDADDRRRFLDSLVGAVDDAYGRVAVVITLRADFYGRPLEHPDFGSRMGDGVVNVVPLSSDELEDAALEPARRSGVTLEPALLAELIADVLGQPGALPMFQFTLTELFDRRTGDRLTIDTYRSIGGLRGALTKGAEDLFQQMDPAEQDVARQLFLRLVAITEGDEWSRRRVPAAELIALDTDVVAMQRVIEAFTGRRLLSADRDQATGNPTVEVAHEALLSGWDRLKEWIETSREDLIRHRELAFAAGRWEASERDRDYLYMGGRLDETVRWATTSSITLTEGEREFLDAGLTRQKDEEAVEEARLARQQQLERTTRRRTRGLAAVLFVLAAVVAGVVWAVVQSGGPKIALVHEGGDSDIQALLREGFAQADRDLDFQAATVAALIDPEEDLRELAEAGYGLIISGLLDGGFTAYEVAAEFPETLFIQIDGVETDLENVTIFDFVREGGAFLIGAAAALQSETGRIGFIGGFQQDSTEVRRAAYTDGARWINPEIVVDAVYLGPYHDGRSGYLDVDLARSTADAMYRSGVDVIHHSAGEAAAALPVVATELSSELGRELWVIGSEIDERRDTPSPYRDRFLTSMWKRWDLAVADVIDAYLKDELEPGVVLLGLADGAVDYSTEGSPLSADNLTRLERIKQDIISGSIEPSRTPAEAPGWTRPPQMTVTAVYDGSDCTADLESADLFAGDVVRVDIINRSDHSVMLGLWQLDDEFDLKQVLTGELDPWQLEGVFPWGSPTSLIGPDGTGAVEARLTTGNHIAGCLTPDRNHVAAGFTAHFETTCEGSAVDSDEPGEVVRALIEAENARDAGATCSLFHEDAIGHFFEGSMVIDGNRPITDFITPFDDDLYFRRIELLDLETSGDVVTATTGWWYYGQTEPDRRCITVAVTDGRISDFTSDSCPEE